MSGAGLQLADSAQSDCLGCSKLLNLNTNLNRPACPPCLPCALPLLMSKLAARLVVSSAGLQLADCAESDGVGCRGPLDLDLHLSRAACPP